MDFLASEHSTLLWFCFTLYGLTVIFLFPNVAKVKSPDLDVLEPHVWQFASRFLLRAMLIIPMIFLISSTI